MDIGDGKICCRNPLSNQGLAVLVITSKVFQDYQKIKTRFHRVTKCLVTKYNYVIFYYQTTFTIFIELIKRLIFFV